MEQKVSFACDYMEGAHPAILEKLALTNLDKTPGYGLDSWSESARAKIRAACRAPGAEIFFMTGGTQTNAVVIDALLRSYQGVVAADSGHISVHEAGAIELGGHKVMTVPGENGKLQPERLQALLENYHSDANRGHMVMPGMVYISQPTEYGTLYSRGELAALSRICRENHLPLYLDGARLAYALACVQNDVTLPDIASLCDAFYIGGTKCGALFGEALVFPKAGLIPHFFTIIKQHGALLAKGRLLGLQFDVLFTDELYRNIGKPAIAAADAIRRALTQKGYQLCFASPTNQVFCIIENSAMERLGQQVEFSFWERYDDTHSVIRFAASWATTPQDTRRLCESL